MQLSQKTLDDLVDRIQRRFDNEDSSFTTTDLHQAVEDAENAELRSRGWEMTCGNPGSLWLWKKGPWLVGRDTAIYLEEYL